MKGVRLTAPGTEGLFIHSTYSSDNDESTQAAFQPLLILSVCSTARRAKTSPVQMKTKQTLGPEMKNKGI